MHHLICSVYKQDFKRFSGHNCRNKLPEYDLLASQLNPMGRINIMRFCKTKDMFSLSVSILCCDSAVIEVLLGLGTETNW